MGPGFLFYHFSNEIHLYTDAMLQDTDSNNCLEFFEKQPQISSPVETIELVSTTNSVKKKTVSC